MKLGTTDWKKTSHLVRGAIRTAISSSHHMHCTHSIHGMLDQKVRGVADQVVGFVLFSGLNLLLPFMPLSFNSRMCVQEYANA